MWLGSPQKSNLQTPAGDLISPADLRVGDQYVVNLNVYMRSGRPDPAYNQQPSIAVVQPNTRIELKGTPVPYDRSTGKQYWAEVRVVSLGNPTVYFQFATAPREQAQAVSAALQTKGYRIPGEERSTAAAGQRQVRFFYPQDKNAAAKLASEVNTVLQGLGYSSDPPVMVADVSDSTGKKKPAGVVELSLDLPAR